MNAVYSNVRRSNHRRARMACRYPNAAARGYFADRLADTILCSASCAGIVAIVYFLMTMGL